ncbi:hypothetical protein T484DRAFT_1764433 [Baffinella frigidus]|nr:hypothetical protein T484DRAFT_1764433 [Cryptophyta sp. CCMP2293]
MHVLNCLHNFALLLGLSLAGIPSSVALVPAVYVHGLRGGVAPAVTICPSAVATTRSKAWGACSLGMSKQQDPDEKGAIPECASRTQLRYLQLNQKLKVALEGERFKEASCLKAQMENLLSEHMTEVRAQVLDASQKMKEARERRCRTTRGRLELQLEEAVLEENYQRASDLKHDLELEKRASHNVSPVV